MEFFTFWRLDVPGVYYHMIFQSGKQSIITLDNGASVGIGNAFSFVYVL
jgi:hypothetical protein